MLKLPVFKKLLIVGAITALAIVLYEASDLLLIYKYFAYEYYIAGIAVVALTAGILIAKSQQNSVRTGPVDKPASNLTNRELQILNLIAAGKSNKEIAAINFVELSTVKTHINNIYTKLNVTGRKEAVERYRYYV